MTTLARFCCCALILWPLLAESKADTRYDVTPPPTWVVPAELAPHKASDVDSHRGGTDYVLVDHQIRLDSVELHYARFVSRLTNVSGLEDSSQITIGFDPKIERLHVHSISIRRGDRIIDQLRNGRVRVIQRENSLEDQLVDGELTFHLVMSDVRVGDTIDYSYTIERRNAEWGNRNFGRLVTQWDAPVENLRVRLLSPVGSPLYTFSYPAVAPSAAVIAGSSILEWSKTNVAGLRFEKEAPRWFQQYGAIEFSQFPDWGQIAAAAIPLYAVAAAPSSELKELTSRLASAASSDAQRAIEVMRFVQEEIRYTGIEEGEGAFRPTPPNEVLARRYGDCKDKTLLAVTLLRALGIEAAPALVSTHWKAEVANHLPSPGLMNHVVVRAVVGGAISWFDATSTGQGGQLANFTQASFGKALVISPGVIALEPMVVATASKPQIQSHYVFDLRAGWFAQSTLKGKTIYLDAEADRMRRRLRAKGSAELADSYLRYYKGEYSGTRSAEPLKVTDKVDSNELSIDESYVIKDAFETDKQGKQKLYVNADMINEVLRKPDLTDRTTPLAVDFPYRLSTQIEFLLPVAYEVDPEKFKVNTAIFHYASGVSYGDKVITLDYEYEALTDHVPVAGLPAHIKDLERARDDTYFHITRSPRDAIPARQSDSFLVVKIVAGLAGLFLMLRLLRYAVGVQAYLASTLTHVRSRESSEAQVPDKERTLLLSLDDELVRYGFVPAGVVECTALYTRYGKPDYFRVLRHSDSPMTAFVTRHIMPEYGACVRIWFETDLADGTRLQTTDGVSDASMTPPGVSMEGLSGATVPQLIKRHEDRVKALSDKGVVAPGYDMAERLTAGFAAIRAEWLRKGWIRGTAASEFDRFTFKGAVRLTRASLRMHGARAGGPALLKASKAASSTDRGVRADADFVAAWHLSKLPHSAPGLNKPLIVYMGTLWLAALGVVAAVTDLYVAAMWLSAVVLHESAHLLVLGRQRASPSLLFLLPYIGMIKAEAPEELALTSRVSIVLAGPLTGLLIGVLLLWADVFAPNQYLSAAAHLFIGLNALLLVPYPGTDGFRVLYAITAPGSVMRPAVQLVSAIVVLVIGIHYQNQFFSTIGFLLGVWFVVQLPTFNLLRNLARQIPRDSDWDGAAYASFVAMTGTKFARWSAAIRQSRAVLIANELTRPSIDRRDRILVIAAFACCAGLAICAALGSLH